MLFYNIDEYYLSYSNSFQNTHYCHDTYVYGYENSTFLNILEDVCVYLAQLRKKEKELINLLLAELKNE